MDDSQHNTQAYAHPSSEHASTQSFPLGAPVLPQPISDFPDFGHISLANIHNARDLGGMPCEDGRVIAPARLIRSDALHHGKEADFEILINDHNLARVVDLRSDLERAANPDPFDTLSQITFYELPVFEGEALGITHGGKNIKDDLETFEHFNKDPFEIVCSLYPSALLSEQGKKTYTAFLDILATHDTGATLWHCTEGKDRTGLGALLIEKILGVSDEDIYKDYLATNLFVRTLSRQLADFLGRHHIAQKIDSDVDALFYAQKAFLDAALKGVKDAYGSFDAYLEQALDCDAAKQEHLRHTYLVTP